MMTAQPPRIVIIGAGATGRGQIGQLAFSAGWAVTYIERRPGLAESLRKAGEFRVMLAGPVLEEIRVDGFEVLHTSETESCAQAIAQADVVATAVIPTNLSSVCSTLLAGLRLRRDLGVVKPLNVIACENMERSSSTLRTYLKEQVEDQEWESLIRNTGFPDSMVARAVPVPEPDPLVLIAEATQEWSVDANAVEEPMPRLEGMTLTTNQEAALERKLYIKNTGHFSIGLLGFRKGYTLMDEAARDPEIQQRVDAATRESAAALVAKHGFDPGEIEDYRRSFLEAMKSPCLPDDIRRVIREPIRKLAREERLVGPAMLACQSGGTPRNLAFMIAATLTTMNPEDPQSCELAERGVYDGVAGVLADVAGIPVGHPLLEWVMEAYIQLIQLTGIPAAA